MKKFSKFTAAFSLSMLMLSQHIGKALAQDAGPAVKFDDLDPLKIGGSSNIDVIAPSAVQAELQTPGAILTRFLLYAFPIAGIILFVMILWGGFEILSGATSSKSKDAARQRITAALLGFLLLFAAYWIAQIIQVVFGIQFLNPIGGGLTPAAPLPQ